jgi:hypothetical protein
MQVTKYYPGVQREVTRHGKTVYYFRIGKRERLRVRGEVGSPEFDASYAKAVAQAPTPDVRNMKTTKPETRKQATEKTLKVALLAAKKRAKDKGLPFDLDLDFLLNTAQAQNFSCLLTGIEFFAKVNHSARVNPTVPSIDRIVPDRGYTKDNVRLVIYAINAMLLDWGEELFIRVANSYRYQKRSKSGESKTGRERKTPAPQKFSPKINSLRSGNKKMVRSRKATLS